MLESDAVLDHVSVSQHAVLFKTVEIFVLFCFLKHSPSFPPVLMPRVVPASAELLCHLGTRLIGLRSRHFSDSWAFSGGGKGSRWVLGSGLWLTG